MRTHDTMQQLISVGIDGALTDHEQVILEAHLKTCAACRRFQQDMETISASLTAAWPDEDLSPDLERNLIQGLEKAHKREGKAMHKPRLLIQLGGTLALICLCIMSLTLTQRTQRGRLAKGADSISKKIVTKPDNRQVRVREEGALLAKNEEARDTTMGVAGRAYEPYAVTTGGALAPQKAKTRASKPMRLARALEKERDGRRDVYKRDANKDVSSMHAGRTLSDEKKQFKMARVEGVSSSLRTAQDLVQERPVAMTPQAQRLNTVAFKKKRRLASNGPFVDQGVIKAKHVKEEITSGLMPIAPPVEKYNRETYDRIDENPFMQVKDQPLSTFSIDVDTASYSNTRRFLNNQQLPPVDAVRIEELINYFTYDYPQPAAGEPFSITTDMAVCPWNMEHQIARVGLQGMQLSPGSLPPSNLVFLIDVSGSMNQPQKLPLLKQAFEMLVNQLGKEERVAIVVYAGAAGTVLEPTPGDNTYKIKEALARLHAGGSTAGGAGIQLAYQLAKDNFIPGGNNRVILATDGDFNVGVSSPGALTRLIEQKRQQGIFLTVLGFGTGNYQDARMEQLANKGNGNYYYIDTQHEAKKVLVRELGSTLFAIAKDVKIQIEFNPSQVKAYRLIGYENRMLAKEDFNDDSKDAGDLGAGHTVTALYEIVPAGSAETFRAIDDLVYQTVAIKGGDDVMTVKLRYKAPDATVSQLMQRAVTRQDVEAVVQGDFAFASAVAEFGLLLRDSSFKGTASYDKVIQRARASKGKDAYGYRSEFMRLVTQARALDARIAPQGNGIQFKGR